MASRGSEKKTENSASQSLVLARISWFFSTCIFSLLPTGKYSSSRNCPLVLEEIYLKMHHAVAVSTLMNCKKKK